MKPAILLVLISAAAVAQTVSIRVDAAKTLGRWKPIEAYFGYDEPNYTYTKNGRKLVRELAQSNPGPVYIRTHFMLATGDGVGDVKWGSTNAYTEDANGKPVYDWTLVDRILDTYVEAHAKPFVEIGFMPKALSTKPDPYRPEWAPGASFDKYYVGWSYPPKDYTKWGELVFQWVKHEVDKHGADEVASWYWEVWNEPDIPYWHGTAEEYNELYDYAAAAVKRALPRARVGGPATTGPGSAKAAEFLRQFLEHCASGKNYMTGAVGSPLDFITYHAKGRPAIEEGRVRMGLDKQMTDVERGFQIVRSFPKFRDHPIVLSESDPEGCAACSARVYPQNAYRNGPLYAAYTAASMGGILKLADQYGANIEGMLTWAFQFENAPYFEGFRTLATNGIDKPVLNFFRMAGLMGGERVSVEGASNALASRAERAVSALVWNYEPEDVPGPDSPVRLTVAGLPVSSRRVLLTHYRIDGSHSNAYAAWKQMGSPQNPTAEQYAQLESAGQLELLESPRWVRSESGQVEVEFALPREGLSLVQVSW